MKKWDQYRSKTVGKYLFIVAFLVGLIFPLPLMWLAIYMLDYPAFTCIMVAGAAAFVLSLTLAFFRSSQCFLLVMIPGLVSGRLIDNFIII